MDVRDKENRTPLHSAAWQDHAKICRILLEQGASVNAVCSQGASALCIASQEGHIATCEVLLKVDMSFRGVINSLLIYIKVIFYRHVILQLTTETASINKSGTDYLVTILEYLKVSILRGFTTAKIH